MVEADDVSGARKYYKDGLKIYEKLGDERGVAVSLINLGYIALLEADLTDAHRLFQRSLSLFETIGDKEGVSVALGNIAHTLLANGDLSSAISMYRKGLAAAVDLGYKDGMANALEGIAAVLAQQKALDEAARLTGACETLRIVTGSSREQFERMSYERTMHRLQEGMSAHRFRSLAAEGRRSADRVIDEQLDLMTGK